MSTYNGLVFFININFESLVFYHLKTITYKYIRCSGAVIFSVIKRASLKSETKQNTSASTVKQ